MYEALSHRRHAGRVRDESPPGPILFRDLCWSRVVKFPQALVWKLEEVAEMNRSQVAELMLAEDHCRQFSLLANNHRPY